MSHVTQDMSWCTIDIDTSAGKIVVRDRRQYVWLLHAPRMTRWTLSEKQKFTAHRESSEGPSRKKRRTRQLGAMAQMPKAPRGAKGCCGPVPVLRPARWRRAEMVRDSESSAERAQLIRDR